MRLKLILTGLLITACAGVAVSASEIESLDPLNQALIISNNNETVNGQCFLNSNESKSILNKGLMSSCATTDNIVDNNLTVNDILEKQDNQSLEDKKYEKPVLVERYCGLEISYFKNGKVNIIPADDYNPNLRCSLMSHVMSKLNEMQIQERCICLDDNVDSISLLSPLTQEDSQKLYLKYNDEQMFDCVDLGVETGHGILGVPVKMGEKLIEEGKIKAEKESEIALKARDDSSFAMVSNYNVYGQQYNASNVANKNVVAVAAGKQFSSLQEAINYVRNGGIVELVAKHIVEKTIFISKDVTIVASGEGAIERAKGFKGPLIWISSPKADDPRWPLTVVNIGSEIHLGKNKNVIIDGGNIDGCQPLIVCENAYLNLDNAELRNNITNSNNDIEISIDGEKFTINGNHGGAILAGGRSDVILSWRSSIHKCKAKSGRAIATFCGAKVKYSW